ncbi:2'-5' RNA ligase family protein [Sphingobium mellinum]|uniref:2'-5' RNA ligase family protein n=1 Tax=Sphingobium mellinum TaxID=1387166 RepID=UPI0030EF0049
MGADDFAWAEGLRRAHFPPDRNLVPAHITLFHHLPPSLLPELAVRMKMLCAERAPAAQLSAIMPLGHGVAYRVDSDALIAIREELSAAFAGLLVPQDEARPRLHITVSNKIDPQSARALASALRADFRPRRLQIAGLAAWYYRGGPWELAVKARFRG